MSTAPSLSGTASARHRASSSDLPRVMILADHFGYPGGVVHGVTTYFLEVLPALAAAGVKLTACFMREPHPAAEALRDCGIDPIFLSAARMNPFAVTQVASIARRNRCQVLHATGIKGILMARLATRFVPARAILHLHDLIAPSAGIAVLQRAAARRSDAAVCVSAAAVPIAMRSYGVGRDRIRVIHNGIELGRFTSVTEATRPRMHAALGIAPGRPVLLVVGRMHAIKGQRAALQAMPTIVRQCPDVLLLLAGDGPERAACEALAGQLGLGDHVRFLGQRRDIPDLLQACDLVLIPSQSEGLPIAAIEAHAAGRPVVGFDVGGVGEVVQDGVTGRVVPAADVAALGEAAAALLRDATARAACAAAARRAAESFSLANHVESLLDFYRDVDGGHLEQGTRAAPGDTRWAS